MKKVIVFFLIIMSISFSLSAKRLTVSAHVNYFMIEDSTYTDVYGENKFFPEGKISLRIFGNLYAWGGYGTLRSKYGWVDWSHKGLENADLDGENVYTQHLISAGLGFFAGYIEPHGISVKAEVGVCRIVNTENTTVSEKVGAAVVRTAQAKKSATGIRGNLAGTYGLLKNVFGELGLGYMYVPFKDGEDTINLGGFRLSLGLGFTF